MPSARMNKTVRAKAGLRRNWRKAWLRSWRTLSRKGTRWNCRASSRTSVALPNFLRAEAWASAIAEAGLAFEIGAHGEMGLDLFGDFGVHARAPEQSAPDPFHTNLKTRVTPFDTLSQFDSASSRRWRPEAVSL